MKRKILFNGVWLSLILVCMNSCQNELDESLIAENGVSKSSFQTKSSNVVSALEQLENIPVNIKLVNANTDMIYLSARPKDKTIVLHNCDDGSLRQRWYISKGVNTGIPTIGTSSVINIKVVGGAKTNGYICPTGSVSAPGLILIDNVFGAAPFFYSPTSDGTSYAFSVYFRPDQMGVLGVMEYLYAKTIGGKEVAFGPENVAMGKNQWEIVPVENFRLIDVKYVEEENDKVLSSIDFIRTYDFNNSTGMYEAMHELDLTDEIVETSSFSEVKGISMTNKVSNSVSVGVPIIGINGSINTEVTTSKNWTYTTTETTSRKRTVTDKFTFKVPPYTFMQLDVYKVVYDINVTYIATFEGVISKKIIKLEGKWNGRQFSKFSYNPHEKE